MCDILNDTDIWVIDNSPEYQDSLDIKIDIYSDNEYEKHIESKDTSLDIQTNPSTKIVPVPTPVVEPSAPTLEQRVNTRVESAYARLLEMDKIGRPLKTSHFTSSREEVLEFMKIVTKGAKVTKIAVSPPAAEVKPKRKRGRPRKYPVGSKPAPKRRGRKPGKTIY